MGAIIWLASYPKSGNTWMRAFLHNLMRNPSESYDINRLADLTLGESQVHWYQKLDPRPPAEYSVEDVMRMRPIVQRAIMDSRPDSVFVKTHNAMMGVSGQALIANEVTAGAIYVVRNPLDVTISYSYHLGKTIDDTIEFMSSPRAMTASSEKNVFEHLTTWSMHVDSWTKTAEISGGKLVDPGGPLHVVRYEDMLDAPVRTFGGVAKFLGLTPPRERLDKAIKLSSFKVLQAQERRKGFHEKSQFADAFFREGKANQWQKLLSAEQADRIRDLHGDQMHRFGYV
jgi:hypothetical protein